MASTNGTGRAATPTVEDEDFEPVDTRAQNRLPLEEPEPRESKHSPLMLRWARDLGISKQDLAIMTPEELREEVSFQRQAALAEKRAGAENRQTTRPEPTPEPEFELDLGEVEIEPGKKKKLTIDDIEDPITKSVLNALKTQHAKFRDLEKKNEELTRNEIHRQQKALDDMYDGIFDALPEQYGLGEGNAAELAGTKAAKRRKAVAQAAGVDFRKDSIAAAKKKLAAAAHELFGPDDDDDDADDDDDEVATLPRKRQRARSQYEEPEDLEPRRGGAKRRKSQAEEWEQAAGPRPTQRDNAPEPKGTRRADKAVANKLRKMGHETLARRPHELEDDLPD